MHFPVWSGTRHRQPERRSSRSRLRGTVEERTVDWGRQEQRVEYVSAKEDFSQSPLLLQQLQKLVGQ